MGLASRLTCVQTLEALIDLSARIAQGFRTVLLELPMESRSIEFFSRREAYRVFSERGRQAGHVNHQGKYCLENGWYIKYAPDAVLAFKETNQGSSKLRCNDEGK